MNTRTAITLAILVTVGMASLSQGLPAGDMASGVPGTSASVHAATADQPKVIPIVAHRFAFEPNRITLKKGVPVTLQLSSQDVQHGFYIRGLKVDEEIQPGKNTEVTITPDKAGTFPTICDHFCGLGHKDMNMTIVVEE
jgi:cytochrome c oxidase subunit II